MRVVPFPPEESKVVAACSEAHVVLEFILVDCEDLDVHDEWTHRLAAIAGVDAVCRTFAGEIALRADLVPEVFRNQDGQIREVANTAIDHWNRAATQAVEPSQLHGRRITPHDLYGAGFDHERSLFKEEATKFSRDVFDPAWTLTDAFVQTPYRLDVSGPQLHQLWTGVVEQVLGRPDAAAPIHRWDGDWSTFFDAGREWWGAAAWTIGRGAREIVVVCASTTD